VVHLTHKSLTYFPRKIFWYYYIKAEGEERRLGQKFCAKHIYFPQKKLEKDTQSNVEALKMGNIMGRVENEKRHEGCAKNN